MKGEALDRPRLRAPALLWVALAGCSPPSQNTIVNNAVPPPVAAPSASATAAAGRCRPPVPEPPAGGTGVAGPAYVLVDRVGVLRIDDGTATTALRIPGSSWGTDLVATPAGEVWVSDWEGVRVLGPAGAVRSVRTAQGGPRYEKLAVRSPTDVWAVTSDSDWSIVHYDGSTWTPVRRRDRFPGKYDDNKIDALAVTSDAVWVSTWNGLWRGAGEDWQKVDLPDGAEGQAHLWVYRDRLIAGVRSDHFLRDGTGWKKLSWPEAGSVQRSVGDLGLVASPRTGAAKVVIGSILGDGCAATSDSLQGSDVHDVAVDGSGRVWVATDYALGVLDRDGSIVAEWPPGTLDGLSGRILSVAVVGTGPARLPPALPGRIWQITGRLQVYKSSTPLAGAELELCSAITTSDRCDGAPFVRKTTSGPDGSFRFADVPEGSFRIHVRPPPAEKGCEGVFSEVGYSLTPAIDCHGTPAAPDECDLGTVQQCLPFEMPPPP